MQPDAIVGLNEPVLVTGANGFLGQRVVDVLLGYGFSDVRCFVRPSGRMDGLKAVVDRRGASAAVRYVAGDVVSTKDCRAAVAGVKVVFHLAAGFDKSFAGAFMTSAVGTRNLVEAFLETEDPRRIVVVSSFAVYSNRTLRRGALLDESTPLEDAPQERFDAYAYGKLKQEEVVRRYGADRGLRYVILRPGTVYGPGKKDLTGRIGTSAFGFFIHVGGRNELPLTYVDNCAEAIVLAGMVPGIEGETFNVVDDERMSSTEFLRAYRRRRGRFFVVRLPYRVAYMLSAMWEDRSRRTGGQLPPVFNRRRCDADWKGNRFSNKRLRERLGWVPRVPLADGMARFLAQFEPGAAE